MTVIAKINVNLLLVRIFHLRTSIERLREKIFVLVISCHKHVNIWIVFILDLRCLWRHFFWAKNMPEVDTELERLDELHDNNDQAKYNINRIKVKWHCEGETVSDIYDSRGQRDKIN